MSFHAKLRKAGMRNEFQQSPPQKEAGVHDYTDDRHHLFPARLLYDEQPADGGAEGSRRSAAAGTDGNGTGTAADHHDARCRRAYHD